MKVKDIILEVSRAERERQRAVARATALTQQRELQRREEERLRAIAQRKLQRNLPHALASEPKKTPAVSQSGFTSSELDAYRVDPNVDPDFQGGYYLRFYTDLDGTTAYWSKGALNYEQAVQFKQTQRFGKRFDPAAFQNLIDTLISQTSSGDQPGYIHIEIDGRYLNNPFYTALYQYLLKHYPHDEYTQDASVNWELI